MQRFENNAPRGEQCLFLPTLALERFSSFQSVDAVQMRKVRLLRLWGTSVVVVQGVREQLVERRMRTLQNCMRRKLVFLRRGW